MTKANVNKKSKRQRKQNLDGHQLAFGVLQKMIAKSEGIDPQPADGEAEQKPETDKADEKM